MTWWEITLACLAYSIPGWRLVCRHVYELNLNSFRNPHAESLILALIFATLGFWTWPVWLLVFFCKHISDDDPHKFAKIVGGTSKAQKQREVAAERKTIAKRIEDAERRLGIGDKSGW